MRISASEKGADWFAVRNVAFNLDSANEDTGKKYKEW